MGDGSRVAGSSLSGCVMGSCTYIDRGCDIQVTIWTCIHVCVHVYVCLCVCACMHAPMCGCCMHDSLHGSCMYMCM